MLKMEKSVRSLLSLKNVWDVLVAAGADDYWNSFLETILDDMRRLGDGSAYFKTCMRKLRRASAVLEQPAPALPVADPVQKAKTNPAVRQKLMESIPQSYMPHPTAPIRAGSLIAAYMSANRCKDLGLVGFEKYEPIIGKILQVLGPDAYECMWLESQSVRGVATVDGLPDGYNGKWQPWTLPNGEQGPPAVVCMDDIYAANFKFTPGNDRMCNALKSKLKEMLEIFKGNGN